MPSDSKIDYFSYYFSSILNYTGVAKGLFLFSFWIKIFLRMFIFWLFKTSFSYYHFLRFFIISAFFAYEDFSILFDFFPPCFDKIDKPEPQFSDGSRI